MFVAAAACVFAPHASAQDACCFEPKYRLQCETVMQPQTVQRYKIAYETEYVAEEVTSYRPVLKTRTEEREYTVAKPIVETKYREERYTVWTPIVETSYRDETVTQTRYVTETAEREERVTTYRPVVETSYYQQQYTVQRPVVETQYIDQQYTVQRPVVETQYQTQQVTSLRPVTTMQNQTVDIGGYVAQQVVTPGQVSYGLQTTAYYSRGLFGRLRPSSAVTWAPQASPATVQTQYAYRPNYVTQQVARTSYVQDVRQVQVPVQVQRMQTEVVTQRVPVQVQRMQTEVINQQIPVQTTRMVPTTEVRKIPYTVQRPVTETLTRKIPVQKQRWVTEVRVRKVPVRTTRTIYETRREPVQVQYYEQEIVKRTVMRPVTRRKYIPYTETVMVPKQVVQRMPLSYYDPFSSAIVNGYSSFSTPIVSSSSSSSVVTQPDESVGESILSTGGSFDETPSTRMQKVETGDLEPESAASVSEAETDPFDNAELPSPTLEGPENEDDDDDIEAQEAGWRIRWNPVYARQA
jgi:hypothetical protein